MSPFASALAPADRMLRSCRRSAAVYLRAACAAANESSSSRISKMSIASLWPIWETTAPRNGLMVTNPFALEDLQGFPHRVAGHAESLTEGLLDEALAGRDLAVTIRSRVRSNATSRSAR